MSRVAALSDLDAICKKHLDRLDEAERKRSARLEAELLDILEETFPRAWTVELEAAALKLLAQLLQLGWEPKR